LYFRQKSKFMAIARKSDSEDSPKGGWFGRRRSQRRENPRKSSASINTSGLQKRPPQDTLGEVGSKNANIRNTSHPSAKLRVPATSKTNPKNKPPTNVAPKRSQSTSANSPIPVMSSATEAMPIWLLRLHALQRHTSVATFLLAIAMLVAYGWTVYSQQVWSQSYRKLVSLQRHERQLNITNNVLKNNMATDAEKPSAGLVSPSPAGTIFLPAASASSSSTEPTNPSMPAQPSTAPAPGY
jgi:hypothetical protein